MADRDEFDETLQLVRELKQDAEARAASAAEHRVQTDSRLAKGIKRDDLPEKDEPDER